MTRSSSSQNSSGQGAASGLAGTSGEGASSRTTPESSSSEATYSKLEVDSKLNQLMASISQLQQLHAASAEPTPSTSANPIVNFRNVAAKQNAEALAEHRSANQVFTDAWKVRSDATFRSHEFETTRAYALAVLQNNVVDAMAQGIQQYATAGLAGAAGTVSASVLRDMTADLRKTIQQQRDFNDAQRVLHRTVMMYPETPSHEMKAAIQQSFAQAKEADAAATLQKTCQEYAARRQKLDDQYRNQLRNEVTVSIQNSTAGGASASVSTPVPVKGAAARAGTGAPGPGTGGGGRGKGGVKGGGGALTGSKRTAAQAGLGPDLARATGAASGGADASPVTHGVDLSAAAGMLSAE